MAAVRCASPGRRGRGEEKAQGSSNSFLSNADGRSSGWRSSGNDHFRWHYVFWISIVRHKISIPSSCQLSGDTVFRRLDWSGLHCCKMRICKTRICKTQTCKTSLVKWWFVRRGLIKHGLVKRGLVKRELVNADFYISLYWNDNFSFKELTW